MLGGIKHTARASSTLDSVFSCRLVAGAVEGGFLAAGTLCLCSADAAAARVGFAAGWSRVDHFDWFLFYYIPQIGVLWGWSLWYWSGGVSWFFVKYFQCVCGWIWWGVNWLPQEGNSRIYVDKWGKTRSNIIWWCWSTYTSSGLFRIKSSAAVLSNLTMLIGWTPQRHLLRRGRVRKSWEIDWSNIDRWAWDW